jgi:dihydroorotate dehydrogenase
LRARVGDRIALVSVGGISSVDDVWQRLVAGATLVQLYTGFIYEGPLVVRRIHRQLLRRMDEKGVRSVRHLHNWDEAAPRNDALIHLSL